MTDTPRHPHHCPRCVFLGREGDADFHACPDHARHAGSERLGPAVVRRADPAPHWDGCVPLARWHSFQGSQIVPPFLKRQYRTWLKEGCRRGLFDKCEAEAILSGVPSEVE